jgi:hypothetical protein
LTTSSKASQKDHTIPRKEKKKHRCILPPETTKLPIMTIEQLTYTGDNCTMVCLVDDEMLQKYRHHEEGVVPSHVVDSFDIFKFESGKQGTLSRPSKSEMSAIFGTNNKDRAIEFMLEKGKLQSHHGRTNGEGEQALMNNAKSRYHVERSGRPL